ncbi:MAG: SUMF1/EgtB/PvdO family nonheme iron enzyme [Proteobacteria bacterium]|nr:SUMF1/EgtB/PvdO family nonheme iron enzyme [Pseudomonadota bacterium]
MKDIIKKCLPTYDIVDKIGEGIHGSVYKVKDQFKERAVKIVPIRVERSRLYKTETDLDSKVSQDFHAVREYYETIKGDGVVGVHDFHLVDKHVSKKEAEAYLVILMELCPVNLQDHIIDNFPLSAATGIRYMKSLAEVLERLSRGMRNIFLLTDFKPSNLLISDDDRLLIGDLGGLKRLSSVSTITNAQFTPNWSAPEMVLKGERPTLLSAIYSYGLVSYYIWEGQLPYENDDFIERIGQIKEKGIRYDNTFIPDTIRELILLCLKFDADKRPGSFEEILGHIRKIENPLTGENAFVSKQAPKAAGEKDKEGDEHFSTTMDMGTRKNSNISVSKSYSRVSVKQWREPSTQMDFVWVDGGTFKMGCIDGDEYSLSNEKPAHDVEVDGFWLGRYPVTQQQWKMVMGNNPSHFIKSPEHPVEQVSWDDTQRFLIRMNASAKKGSLFLLPSEKQWEYAARSRGNVELYAGGKDIGDVAWYKENSNHSTQAVGLKQPNSLGLFDMCGNVMEWCEDIFDDEAYKKGKPDMPGRLSHGMDRVARGGGYNLDAKRCRTTARRRMAQGLKYVNLGLRIVMSEE